MAEENGKKKRSKNNYLENDDLLQEVIACKKKGQMSNALVSMMQLMIDKISGPFTYKDEHMREDVKGYAMLVVCNNWHKFDESVTTSAFSWFTSTVINGIRAGWNKYNRATRGTIQISLDALNENLDDD